MARWEDNTVGRLQEAALELYRESGYDKVTVAEISARAGLTRRTFFRYFQDKREVLFYAAEKVEALVTHGIMNAPDGCSALEAVALALAPIAKLSDENPNYADYVRQRHAVIQANAELRERDLSKHASLASVMTASLRSRGVAEIAAKLAAEAGLAAFKVGFERWVDDPQGRKMATHIREAMRGLEPVVLGSVVVKTRKQR